ncbi:hypothetical protein HT031_004064 [Scenedesmus sp. PABB004]|nr:hypothetical protein HT031_004064 [Scenedesmus sp. PABB004]
MARLTALTAVLAALVLAQGTVAQLQICDPKLRVGGIKSINLRSTANSGSYSEITVAWPRPVDGPTGGLNSCISEYAVEVYNTGASTNRIVSATVSVSPAHTEGTYTAKGLIPGKQYVFYVYGRNAALGAGGNGAGLRSQPFTAAPAPAAPSCRQPGPVFNIRRGSALAQGATATMTIEWNAPQTTPANCIAQYVVDVYPAGKHSAGDRIKSARVTSTKFTDSSYTPGASYEFYIYAVGPATLGAMANGQGLRSPPIMAPMGVTTGR